tara:strand:+ start:517 stop:852 length:336 start_codon:yes stop_codon:yes gene_type:complete
MKYVKSIDLLKEGQTKKYQKGQTAKDKFNNLYVLQGIGKDGSNVWLLVRVYQHDLERYRFNDNSNDLRRARRSLRKIEKLQSSFSNEIKKDIRGQFYNNFQQSNGYGRIRG